MQVAQRFWFLTSSLDDPSETEVWLIGDTMSRNTRRDPNTRARRPASNAPSALRQPGGWDEGGSPGSPSGCRARAATAALAGNSAVLHGAAGSGPADAAGTGSALRVSDACRPKADLSGQRADRSLPQPHPERDCFQEGSEAHSPLSAFLALGLCGLRLLPMHLSFLPTSLVLSPSPPLNCIRTGPKTLLIPVPHVPVPAPRRSALPVGLS